nr:PREDICTED: shootin-1-like isoform X1 [Lepisosteus oculatus]
MWSSVSLSTFISTGFQEDSSSSSENEEEIQCEELLLERDEEEQNLSELEHVSLQLLQEISALEVQFEIERSCRETAEDFAAKISKENKILKRQSQALLPLIPEIPEDLESVALSPDPDTDPDPATESLLHCQAQIRELQGSLASLLGDKNHLSAQVEALQREQARLREQLAAEREEKESLLKRLNKQSKTLHRLSRVSQLVSQEHSELSQRLEVEQDLRQHAEVFAHQMLVKNKEASRQSLLLLQSPEPTPQLLQVQNQLAQITTILEELRLQHCSKVTGTQAALEESSLLNELQGVKAQLEVCEEEKRNMESQVHEAQRTVAELREAVNQLQEKLKQVESSPPETDQSQEAPQAPAPPPPPPPPLPPPVPTAVVSPLEALRNRRRNQQHNPPSNTQQPLLDVKTQAVNEMMERIKNGIVLRSISKSHKVVGEEDSAWKDQMSEKRKSVVNELQGILGSIQRSKLKRISRRACSRKVGEQELLAVLQRRRRVMGEESDFTPQPKQQDLHPTSPADSTLPPAGENSSNPVQRRRKTNKEDRASRIRASGSVWMESWEKH